LRNGLSSRRKTATEKVIPPPETFQQKFLAEALSMQRKRSDSAISVALRGKIPRESRTVIRRR
jgi:hypothetical protein